MDGLTPGRVVHYVAPNGDHQAALVTGIAEEYEHSALVYLVTFGLLKSPAALPRPVPFSPTGSPAETWHWIEGA